MYRIKTDVRLSEFLNMQVTDLSHRLSISKNALFNFFVAYGISALFPLSAFSKEELMQEFQKLINSNLK